MSLTDIQLRNAKPAAKPYKLPREHGLFILVNPNGSKWWRFAYRFAGREKLLSLGTCPEVSLSLARQRRDEAHRPSRPTCSKRYASWSAPASWRRCTASRRESPNCSATRLPAGAPSATRAAIFAAR